MNKMFAFKSKNQIKAPALCVKPVHKPCICREKLAARDKPQTAPAEYNFDEYLADRNDCKGCHVHVDLDIDCCSQCVLSWINDKDKRIACPKCKEDMTYCDLESEQKAIKGDYICLCCGFNIKQTIGENQHPAGGSEDANSLKLKLPPGLIERK
jgi:hypothetical protein